MSQSSGPQVPPPTGQGRPPALPAKGADKQLSYKMGLGALFVALFSAISGLYLTITTGNLQTLNQELSRETKELGQIGQQIANTDPKCSQKLTSLKNQQQQIQADISAINTMMVASTSAASSLATMLGKIVDTQKNLLAGVSSNW